MKTKSAMNQFASMKKAATDRIDHISANEKLAGAAAIGVVVGAAATAIGSSLRHSALHAKEAKAMKKPTA